jgi:hypothetical protein
MNSNELALAIRAAKMSPTDEENLVTLIDEYAYERYQVGYADGNAAANSDPS